jgi:hypothetical protein
MKLPLSRFLFVSLVFSGSLQAAFITDFETYGPAGSDVVGQGGISPNVWSINNAIDQYSQIANANVNPTDIFNTSKVLNLGDASAVTTAPTSSNVTLSYPVTGTVGATSLIFDFVIVDSLNTIGFTNRDRFSVSLGNIFSVYFVPKDADLDTPGYQNPTSPGSTTGQWNLFYQVAAGPTVALNLGVLELSQYRFDLQFAENANPLLTDFTLKITSGVPNTLTDGALGLSLDPDTLYSTFNVGWLKMEDNAYGSNSILIDNLNLVPEPSSTLLVALAGLGFATRRRRA